MKLMKKDKLLELFNSLTLEEKIGQLVQLNPDFLNESDTVHTGPISSIGIFSIFKTILLNNQLIYLVNILFTVYLGINS